MKLYTFWYYSIYKLFQTLSSRCEKVLVRQLTLTNAVSLFRLGHMHRGQFLKERSVELIADNFNTIKKTQEWQELKGNPSGVEAMIEIMEYMTNQ